MMQLRKIQSSGELRLVNNKITSNFAVIVAALQDPSNDPAPLHRSELSYSRRLLNLSDFREQEAA